MSIEHAREFHRKAKSDPAIQKELHDRTKDPVDIGRAHDLHFTKEELQQVMGEQERPVSSAQGTWSTFS